MRFGSAAEQVASRVEAGEEVGEMLLSVLQPVMAERGYCPLPYAGVPILHFVPDRPIAVSVCPDVLRLSECTDAEWALTHPRTDLPGDSFVMLFGNAVSAAAWLQNGEIAVETAPACRRRGYARACAAALLSDALARGESPVYRCTARNVASRALAASLGLVLSIHEYCPGFRRG